MAKYSDLNKLVYPYVTACPDMLIEQALVYSAREFFKQTRLWRKRQMLDVIPNCNIYPIQAINCGDAYIEEIPHVFRTGEGSATPSELCKVSYREDVPQTGNQPSHYTAIYPDHLFIGPDPDEKTVFELDLVLVPTVNACSFPDELYESYANAIQHGAIAYLKEQTGHPWHDPSGAAHHRQTFVRLMSEARIRERRGQVNVTERVELGGWI
ncbi:hypothetical protein [Ferrimonas balearica]|uniref:hypothetical protein n=1 Tax=Ferrimonas balearica TaxID=44012 RepID=UPI001F3A28C0|nr:hypothetical protein [Ferrimonas balearica]MBY6093858.1 hypothetical protein [Ferrimonas balearica]